MGPDDTEDNFFFPLIEMLDQVFEETLEEVKNHNEQLCIFGSEERESRKNLLNMFKSISHKGSF